MGRKSHTRKPCHTPYQYACLPHGIGPRLPNLNSVWGVSYVLFLCLTVIAKYKHLTYDPTPGEGGKCVHTVVGNHSPS